MKGLFKLVGLILGILGLSSKTSSKKKAKVKKVDTKIKQVKKNVDDLVIEEAAKYSTKTFTTFDAEVTLKNSASRYDFSNIPEIVTKELELKALKDKHKAAIKSDVIDLDTGELIEPPIVKGGKEVVSIKLNK